MRVSESSHGICNYKGPGNWGTYIRELVEERYLLFFVEYYIVLSYTHWSKKWAFIFLFSIIIPLILGDFRCRKKPKLPLHINMAIIINIFKKSEKGRGRYFFFFFEIYLQRKNWEKLWLTWKRNIKFHVYQIILRRRKKSSPFSSFPSLAPPPPKKKV